MECSVRFGCCLSGACIIEEGIGLLLLFGSLFTRSDERGIDVRDFGPTTLRLIVVDNVCTEAIVHS